MGCTTAPDEKTLAPAWVPRKDRTYELVSKVAYLIGVPLRIFENEHEPPKLELYDQLERDKKHGSSGVSASSEPLLSATIKNQ